MIKFLEIPAENLSFQKRLNTWSDEASIEFRQNNLHSGIWLLRYL